MNIAGARRSIEDEIIQLAPVSITDQLLQGRTSHSTTPQRSSSRTHEETDTEQFDAIFLDRFDEISAILANRIRTLLLYTEHLRHRRTEDIRIKQAHLIAELSQSNGEIGRNRTLTNTTLTRTNGNHILHLRQQFAYFRTRSRLILSNNLHLHIRRNMIMDGSLSSLHRTLEERICITREKQNYLHLHAIDTWRISQHLTLNEVLLGTRINHSSKSLFYQLRI